jgi:hypothetical protein
LPFLRGGKELADDAIVVRIDRGRRVRRLPQCAASCRSILGRANDSAPWNGRSRTERFGRAAVLRSDDEPNDDHTARQPADHLADSCDPAGNADHSAEHGAVSVRNASKLSAFPHGI